MKRSIMSNKEEMNHQTPYDANGDKERESTKILIAGDLMPMPCNYELFSAGKGGI